MADNATDIPTDKLRLVLVSAEAELLDTLCDEVTLPGRAGELGFLPGHAPFLATLQPGVLSYKDGNTTHRVALSGGFCEVFDGGVRVLVDSASLPDDVDAAAVQGQLSEAQTAADEASSESPEALSAAQDLVKALEAQIEIVN